MEPLMTVTDVAKYLKVTPRTVYSFLESGALKGIKIGRSWRVRRHDLERLGEESAATYENSRQSSVNTAIDARSRLATELQSLDDDEFRDLARLISIMRSDQCLRRYKAIFNAMPCATLVADSGGNIVEANTAAARLFGIATADLETMRIGQLPGMRIFDEIDRVFETANRAGGCTVLSSGADSTQTREPIRRIWVSLSESNQAIVQFCCDYSGD